VNENPTHLDLFSGIGGFALAARWAGFETVGFCDNEPYAQAVLKKHWPNVPIHGDIKALDGTAYRGVTLLTGGFPCQPFSCAGKQRGKDDDRYLWRKCSESYKRQGQLGSLVRMLLESSTWDSKKRALIWKGLAMQSNRLLFRLVPLAHSTGETEFGLLPTPTASDKVYGRKPSTKRKNNAPKTSLRDVLSEKFSIDGKGGSPHPTFVEAMMGYPIGHTDLKDWATPSSRKSHTKSSKG